jgi:hypothetical protein
MSAFIYRCPNTGVRVQAFVVDETEDDTDTYETVKCIMCQQVHLVNPATGRVLGENDD